MQISRTRIQGFIGFSKASVTLKKVQKKKVTGLKRKVNLTIRKDTSSMVCLTKSKD